MMNKKGSAMVEAALVFPIVVLSLVALIYIFIYFYDQVGLQVRIHTLLRSECGQICENMHIENRNIEKIPVYRQGGTIYCYGNTDMDSKGLLRGREHKVYSEKYLIDETAIVRIADMAGGSTDEQ